MKKSLAFLVAFLESFIKDERANVQAKISGAVGIVIVTVALLALTPTIVDQVQDMNTTGWSFTGYEGAIVLLDLVPFLWVAGILLGAVAGMYILAKKM